MLRIYFGEKEDVMHGPSWFRFNYDEEWLADPFVEEMMTDIDKSHYKGGQLIESDVLGPIPPEKLSGGLQTLIVRYFLTPLPQTMLKGVNISKPSIYAVCLNCLR